MGFHILKLIFFIGDNMLTFIEIEFLKLKRSRIFLLSILMAALPALLMYIATFPTKEEMDAFYYDAEL